MRMPYNEAAEILLSQSKLAAAVGAVRARPESSFPGQDPCSTWGDGDV